MYLLTVLCLVGTAVALPVLPDPPSLPSQVVVAVDSPFVFTNLPKIEGVHEEKKDENEAEEPKEIILNILPEAPVLPSLDESILKELIKVADVNTPDESGKSELSKDEEPKKEEFHAEKAVETPRNDNAEVKVEEIKIESLKPVAEEKKLFLGIKIPSPPPFLNKVITSLERLPLSLSSIKWPFELPALFNRPRIVYPGYVEEVTI